MHDLLSVWLFVFWLSAGYPDGLQVFETSEACLEARIVMTRQPGVKAVSACFRFEPDLPGAPDGIGA